MSGWRWKPKVALTVVAILIVIQIAVPVIVYLGQPGHPGRFGWQMYAFSSQSSEYVVHTAQGQREVTAGRYMAIPRSDLPVELLLPPHLCRVVPGAQKITWEDGEHRC